MEKFLEGDVWLEFSQNEITTFFKKIKEEINKELELNLNNEEVFSFLVFHFRKNILDGMTYKTYLEMPDDVEGIEILKEKSDNDNLKIFLKTFEKTYLQQLVVNITELPWYGLMTFEKLIFLIIRSFSLTKHK